MVVFSFLTFRGPVALGDTALHYILRDKPCLTADKVGFRGRNPFTVAPVLGGALPQGAANANWEIGVMEWWSAGGKNYL